MPPKIILSTVIEQNLKEKGLSDSSINLYLRNLKKLNGGEEYSNFKFISKPEETMARINDLKDNTKRQYLISIVSSLNSFGDKYKTLANKYYKLMIETAKKISSTPTIVASEAQKENWMEWNSVMEIYNNLKNSLNLTKKKLSDGDYYKLIEYVVLSLFVLTPPRRNMDYMKMLIAFKDTNDKNYNYFVPSEKKFIFNVYKTDNKYGEQVIDVPENLLGVLGEYMKHHPKRKIIQKSHFLLLLLENHSRFKIPLHVF
jgi:hypothetical protein